MVVVYAPEGQQAQLFGAIPAELLPLPSSAQVALGWYANPTIDGDPSGVVTGVSVSGGSATVTYGPIAPLPIGTVRSMAIQTLNANAETYLSTILAPYPSSEALSWDQQLAEATAYTASPTAVTPMLSAIAEASGIPLPQIVQGVIANSAPYKQATGAIIGWRMAMTAKINAADDIATIASLDLTYSQTMASTQASSLGTSSISGLQSTQINSL